MTNQQPEQLYGLKTPDNKILENSQIRDWLEKLEREFAVEYKADKTREAYRRDMAHEKTLNDNLEQGYYQ